MAIYLCEILLQYVQLLEPFEYEKQLPNYVIKVLFTNIILVFGGGFQ